MSKNKFEDFTIPEPTDEELKAQSEHFKRTTPRRKTLRIDAKKVSDGKYVATSVKEVKAVHRDEPN